MDARLLTRRWKRLQVFTDVDLDQSLIFEALVSNSPGSIGPASLLLRLFDGTVWAGLQRASS